MIQFVRAEKNIDRALTYIQDAANSNKLCGDGKYTRMCSEWMERRFHVPKVMLTTSCTMALELAALLCDLEEGDEVITSSFTFVSTVNAFLIHRRVKIKFVDIRPDTMNIDENLIEDAVTDRTRVIVPVHYAGVGCEMDRILEIAGKYRLRVVEDAAQGICADYKGKPLGSIGDFGCYSFHETKNLTMGEGGAICVNAEREIKRAEIIREKGTNRSQFFRGEIDKYSWVDIGSSYLPSEINAAYLLPQLEDADKLMDSRMRAWKQYDERLQRLEQMGCVERLRCPDHCRHNAHLYGVKTHDLEERTRLLSHLKERGVLATFHYVPLHSSEAGKRFGEFVGEDRYTTTESERLVRLPMSNDLSEEEVDYVYQAICEFYGMKQ